MAAAAWHKFVKWTEDTGTSITHFFERGFEWWKEKVTDKTTHWPNVVKPLAMCTFLLIPLNISINFLLSYRLDPVSFFQEHSNYNYRDRLTGGLLATFWIHKIGSIMWNMCAITQVMLLTLSQPPDPLMHRFNGYCLAISSLIMAIAGCILLANGDARYDNFTAAFVVIPAVLVFVCAPWMIIDRTLRLVRGKERSGSPIPHAVMGFILCLPPLGMMLQFIFYSIGVSNSSADDYTGWRVSMFICMPVGIFMLLAFGYNFWLMKKLGPKLGEEQPLVPANPSEALSQPLR